MQKELVSLQESFQKESAKIDAVRASLLDAEVRFRMENHEHLVQSCILVYRAFLKVEASAGIVWTIASLNDLGEIKRKHPHSANLAAFSDWILSLSPKDWAKDQLFEQVAEAELFVSPRIWQLFILAKTLLWAGQVQVSELGIDSKETFVKSDAIKALVVSLFPDSGEYLERFGTSTYASFLKRIRGELVAAIRTEIGRLPVEARPLADASLLAEKSVSESISIPTKYSEFQNNKSMALGD